MGRRGPIGCQNTSGHPEMRTPRVHPTWEGGGGGGGGVGGGRTWVPNTLLVYIATPEMRIPYYNDVPRV